MADINHFPIISSYLIDLSPREAAVLNCLDCSDVAATRKALVQKHARQNSCVTNALPGHSRFNRKRGARRNLFGYPIVTKKRDGIMVNAETLAGG